MKPRGNHRIDPVTPYPRARNSSICSRGAIRGPIKTIPPTGPLLPTLSLHRIILGVRQGNRFNPFPREKRLISHGRNYHTYGKKRINRVNQLCASTSITQRVLFALRIIRNGNNNNNNNNIGRARNDGAVTRCHYARFIRAMGWNSFLMLFRFWNGLIEWPSLCFLVKWRRDCADSSVDLCVSVFLLPYCLYLPRGIWIFVFYSWKINFFDRYEYIKF